MILDNHLLLSLVWDNWLIYLLLSPRISSSTFFFINIGGWYFIWQYSVLLRSSRLFFWQLSMSTSFSLSFLNYLGTFKYRDSITASLRYYVMFYVCAFLFACSLLDKVFPLATVRGFIISFKYYLIFKFWRENGLPGTNPSSKFRFWKCIFDFSANSSNISILWYI